MFQKCSAVNAVSSQRQQQSRIPLPTVAWSSRLHKRCTLMELSILSEDEDEDLSNRTYSLSSPDVLPVMMNQLSSSSVSSINSDFVLSDSLRFLEGSCLLSPDLMLEHSGDDTAEENKQFNSKKDPDIATSAPTVFGKKDAGAFGDSYDSEERNTLTLNSPVNASLAQSSISEPFGHQWNQQYHQASVVQHSHNNKAASVENFLPVVMDLTFELDDKEGEGEREMEDENVKCTESSSDLDTTLTPEASSADDKLTENNSSISTSNSIHFHLPPPDVVPMPDTTSMCNKKSTQNVMPVSRLTVPSVRSNSETGHSSAGSKSAEFSTLAPCDSNEEAKKRIVQPAQPTSSVSLPSRRSTNTLSSTARKIGATAANRSSMSSASDAGLSSTKFLRPTAVAAPRSNSISNTSSNSKVNAKSQVNSSLMQSTTFAKPSVIRKLSSRIIQPATAFSASIDKKAICSISTQSNNSNCSDSNTVSSSTSGSKCDTSTISAATSTRIGPLTRSHSLTGGSAKSTALSSTTRKRPSNVVASNAGLAGAGTQSAAGSVSSGKKRVSGSATPQSASPSPRVSGRNTPVRTLSQQNQQLQQQQELLEHQQRLESAQEQLEVAQKRTESLNEELNGLRIALNRSETTVLKLTLESALYCEERVQSEKLLRAFDAMALTAQYMHIGAMKLPKLFDQLNDQKQRLSGALAKVEEERRRKERLICELTEVTNRQNEERNSVRFEMLEEFRIQEAAFHRQADLEKKRLLELHASDMTTLRTQHEHQIAKLTADAAATLRQTEMRHRCDLQAQDERDAKHLRELERQHALRIDELTERFEEMKLAMSEKLTNMQCECLNLRNQSIHHEEQFSIENEMRLESSNSTSVTSAAASAPYHLPDDMVTVDEASELVEMAVAQYRHLPEEIESLKTVLELRKEEIADMRRQNMELQEKMKELPESKEKIAQLHYKIENLEAIIAMKTDSDKCLAEKHQQLLRKLERENKANKRLSMDNDHLAFRMEQLQSNLEESGAMLGIGTNRLNNPLGSMTCLSSSYHAGSTGSSAGSAQRNSFSAAPASRTNFIGGVQLRANRGLQHDRSKRTTIATPAGCAETRRQLRQPTDSFWLNEQHQEQEQ